MQFGPCGCNNSAPHFHFPPQYPYPPQTPAVQPTLAEQLRGIADARRALDDYEKSVKKEEKKDEKKKALGLDKDVLFVMMIASYPIVGPLMAALIVSCFKIMLQSLR